MNYSNQAFFESPNFGRHIERMTPDQLDRYRIYLETNLDDANSTRGKHWRVGSLKPVWTELLRRVEHKLISHGRSI